MAYEFRLPAGVGTPVSEGFVVNWFKEEGQSVEAGELLLEVQFEKAVSELDAPVSGVLVRILCPQGGVVRAGQPLCLIEERVASGRAGAPVPEQTPGVAGKERAARAPDGSGEIRATPAARRLAREMGIPLGAVAGSGPGGRITEEDVRNSARRRTGPQPSSGSAAGVVRIPLSPSQRAVGERMLRSLHETAQFTLAREVDVTSLVATRDELRRTGSLVTLTDMIHRAVVLALLEQRDMQAVLEGEELTIPGEVHLGFAVARGDDLLVPVIRRAHELDLRQLAAERRRLTQAVMEGRIRSEELEGGTFTVTNLGTYGIDIFTPVLNPPQPAILGVGRVRHLLIPADEGPRAVYSMALSLTVDHRVINGARGARFLEKLSDLLSRAEALVDGALLADG